MNKNMMVEIFISFGRGEEEGSIATGYPIAPNRILTARHALFPDGADPFGEIEVRWHYLNQTDSSYGWQPAQFIDCGLDPALDVALLECEFPQEIDYFCHLQVDNPNRGFKWESEGFACAGKRGETRLPTPLKGETHSAADNAAWLVLTAEGSVEVPELWRGISGAPVFEKDSNALFGVVVGCPPNHNAAVLHATPSWKLLTCDGFRREIGYDIRKEDKEQIRNEIITKLRNSSEACVALGDELGMPGDGRNCEWLTDRLITLPISKLLRRCQSALEHLSQAGDIAAAKVVKTLVDYLLPIVFDQRIIERVCSTSRAGICRVDIATKTVAEIVMAGSDGRATRYQYNQHDDNRGELKGFLLLEEPPKNHGLGSAKRIEDFKRQMINDFAHLDELIAGQTPSDQEQVELANGELEAYAEDDRESRYYIYTLSDKKGEREEQVAVVEALKKSFSAIVFIECSGAVEHINRERREINRSLEKIHTTKLENPS